MRGSKSVETEGMVHYSQHLYIMITSASSALDTLAKRTHIYTVIAHTLHVHICSEKNTQVLEAKGPT